MSKWKRTNIKHIAIFQVDLVALSYESQWTINVIVSVLETAQIVREMVIEATNHLLEW